MKTLLLLTLLLTLSQAQEYVYSTPHSGVSLYKYGYEKDQPKDFSLKDRMELHKAQGTWKPKEYHIYNPRYDRYGILRIER